MMPAEPSTYRDWPKTGEGFGPLEFGPFGRAELALYAAASGDDNPLHLDDAIATAAGLEAPPVQGMLMASCLEPAVLLWRGDLAVTGLAVKFLRPVLAGETIDVSGRVVRAATTAAPELVLRLTVRNRAGEIAVLAEATATVAPTPAEG
jgi:3-hydroxybutyryl-CoA dehydratase